MHLPADPTRNYEEHWQDSIFLNHTLNTLKHIYDERNADYDLPLDRKTSTSRMLLEYFEEEYEKNGEMYCRNMPLVCESLEEITSKFGVKGMYAFFRALSAVNLHHPAEAADNEIFKQILGKVFIPHYEKISFAEAFHGTSALGHVLASPVMPVSAVSAGAHALQYRKHSKERKERRNEPKLEDIKNMIDLVEPMHKVAQHAIDILNEAQCDKYPDLPPVEHEVLKNVLEAKLKEKEQNTRWGLEN